MFSGNMKKIVLWLFVIMISSFSIAGSIYAVERRNGRTPFSYRTGAGQQDINAEKTYDTAGIREIDIGVVDADINVIPVDGTDIKAHLHGTALTSGDGSAPELTTELDGTGLKIQAKDKIRFFPMFHFNGHRELKLDVFIPKSYSDSIKIKTVSGSVDINNFRLTEFNLRSVSGGLNASGLDVGRADIGMVSGETNIEEFKGDLEAHSVSGRYYIGYSVLGNSVEIRSTSGDVKIKLPEASEFEVDSRSVSGRFTCGFPIRMESSHNKGSVRGTVGNGQNQIRINTVSGDVQINKQEDK